MAPLMHAVQLQWQPWPMNAASAKDTCWHIRHHLASYPRSQRYRLPSDSPIIDFWPFDSLALYLGVSGTTRSRDDNAEYLQRGMEPSRVGTDFVPIYMKNFPSDHRYMSKMAITL